MDRPEVVFGLVGALGTDLERVQSYLAGALASVGYSARYVHLSKELRNIARELGLPKPRREAKTKLDELMNLGDALRQRGGNGMLGAHVAITEISRQRRDELGTADGERNSVATIIRQLKHPDEVKLLRDIYQGRFVLIGAWATQSRRAEATTARIQELKPKKSKGWCSRHAMRLMERDERDGGHPLGQRVRDTFGLADAYVTVEGPAKTRAAIGRIVDILFGAPFETPTRSEQAMFQAFGARLRSSAGGRQVGAVALDQDGEILVTGMNDVPKPGGGQYWTGDDPDHRDFVQYYDHNDKEKLRVVIDLFSRLQSVPGWLADDKRRRDVRELASEALETQGPLGEARISDLLEFGRILHAEMAVICTAARRGTPVRGSVLYSTTYPCHQCARLIIGAGIREVVYIDPYPKSLVPEMYTEEVSSSGDLDPDRVNFLAFTGIAPRIFPTVFSMEGRGRDVSGRYREWDRNSARLKTMDDRLTVPILTAEANATERFAATYSP